ncbi:hypothetical protein [Zavarzinella formosa]|uniref:hypothetical protein n=1 Tax=Zavarzinella formosa TaxID=360055 RepID=UPI00030E002E|nr:hypothetical protein [Zavarzinella formosa]
MGKNMMAAGAAWLRKMTAEHASESVTYSRAGVGSVVIPDAVIGQTAFRTSDTAKSRLEWGDCDLIVSAASLVIGGQATEPKKNDRFVRMINGAPVEFEVLAPTGEQPWRHSDQFRTHYRIHGKRVA